MGRFGIIFLLSLLTYQVASAQRDVAETDDILQELRLKFHALPKTEATAMYRVYDENTPLRVRKFYLEQHTHQTLGFARSMAEEFDQIMAEALAAQKRGDRQHLQQMVAERRIVLASPMAMLFELEKWIDVSDPDIALGNAYHGFQAAEALRAELDRPKVDLTPDELAQALIIALFHDVGKVLAATMGFPQWAVVGDTFPLGCDVEDSVVYKTLPITDDLRVELRDDETFSAYFARHQDDVAMSSFALNSDYTFRGRFRGLPGMANGGVYGIYRPQVGLDNLIMAFGHDEYAYRVFAAQTTMAKEFLDVLRFHSFYPLHTGGSYQWVLSKADEPSMRWIRRFNPFDLYSKCESLPPIGELRAYYQKLVDKFALQEEFIWPVLTFVF